MTDDEQQIGGDWPIVVNGHFVERTTPDDLPFRAPGFIKKDPDTAFKCLRCGHVMHPPENRVDDSEWVQNAFACLDCEATFEDADAERFRELREAYRHPDDRGADDRPMRDLLIGVMDDGLPIAAGLVLVSGAVGYWLALDTVIDATSHTWPTLVNAFRLMEFGSPLPDVIILGTVGCLLAGVGIGWQWRRDHDGGEDDR